MFVNLFRKKTDDYYRYWASVSTKGYDRKKKKQTDYVNATIPVRLIPDVKDDLDKQWTKTKNKAIQRVRINADGFFEAVEPREGEPFVRFVIIEVSQIEDGGEDE